MEFFNLTPASFLIPSREILKTTTKKAKLAFETFMKPLVASCYT
jgi:hypothetical protein